MALAEKLNAAADGSAEIVNQHRTMDVKFVPVTENQAAAAANTMARQDPKNWPDTRHWNPTALERVGANYDQVSNNDLRQSILIVHALQRGEDITKNPLAQKFKDLGENSVLHGKIEAAAKNPPKTRQDWQRFEQDLNQSQTKNDDKAHAALNVVQEASLKANTPRVTQEDIRKVAVGLFNNTLSLYKMKGTTNDPELDPAGHKMINDKLPPEIIAAAKWSPKALGHVVADFKQIVQTDVLAAQDRANEAAYKDPTLGGTKLFDTRQGIRDDGAARIKQVADFVVNLEYGQTGQTQKPAPVAPAAPGV